MKNSDEKERIVSKEGRIKECGVNNATMIDIIAFKSYFTLLFIVLSFDLLSNQVEKFQPDAFSGAPASVFVSSAQLSYNVQGRCVLQIVLIIKPYTQKGQKLHV